MSDQFPFRIIDGRRGVADREELSTSSGKTRRDKELLQHLIDEAAEPSLQRVLEACQNRLDALLEDRNRLGRHLHNQVLRPLIDITSNLACLPQVYDDHSSATSCAYEPSLAQLNRLIQELRRIIRELENGAVQEFDLVSELDAMINGYEPLGPLSIDLMIPSHVLNLLTQEEKREVFNITREAVNNCVRHARATRAIIKLNHSRAKIRLAIKDNGIGFCPTETHPPRGYGLPSIQTRVRRLGGELHVLSQKGGGTEIVAEFALEPLLSPA
ncbi:MAG TPA: ATP-binding protein [Nitrospira sp.]|nr:ATP-binding protein [Nitrospira sp.]